MMATRRIYQKQFIDSGLAVSQKTIGFLPAHSFTRISKDFSNWNNSGVSFNTVSDVPRNPDNQADKHELAAMAEFRAHPDEKERVEDILDKNGKGYMLYTAPVWVEAFCLKCHGKREDAPPSIRDTYDNAYDYKVGDLRGLVSIRIPTSKLQESYRAMWYGQIGKTLFGYLVIFLVLGFLIDRLVLSRLSTLGELTRRIALGDYSARLEPSGQDEITNLADSFNTMVDQVERHAIHVHKLAYYDGLTGLPNRTLLFDRIQQLLATEQRTHGLTALILINPDRFRTINDARGHSTGDEVLKACAKRLSGILQEGDTLARMSADEFALLLPVLSQEPERAISHAMGVAQNIHAAFEQPLVIGQEEVFLSLSQGISLFPEVEHESLQDVLRRADTALHRAKVAGGNQIACFEAGMGESVEKRFLIERELRQAIAENQLRLFLQPQVDAQGKPVGAEVLVRWQHPQRGLLGPFAFIPIAEESDLIIDLGAWILTEAFRLLPRLQYGGVPLRLSINISPRQFCRPGFAPWLCDLIRASNADPRYITLEITEGLVMDNIDSVIAKMVQLVDCGFHFAIDDFGTGYSSLSYLKRLPIEELKIDKSFIQDAPTDPKDAALVEAILSVARHMGLRVVAEGVETQEQADFLNARSEVIHQGYFYGRPEPAEDWIGRWEGV
jgi:diguanylate cyclase (GGDEF)-like protein